MVARLSVCHGTRWSTHQQSPFNILKSIEKDLADALLLRSSTLALGLVEEGIWVWAPELASLRV